MDYVIFHNAKLAQKKNILEWVGIDSEFKVSE